MYLNCKLCSFRGIRRKMITYIHYSFSVTQFINGEMGTLSSRLRRGTLRKRRYNCVAYSLLTNIFMINKKVKCFKRNNPHCIFMYKYGWTITLYIKSHQVREHTEKSNMPTVYTCIYEQYCANVFEIMQKTYYLNNENY